MDLGKTHHPHANIASVIVLGDVTSFWSRHLHLGFRALECTNLSTNCQPFPPGPVTLSTFSKVQPKVRLDQASCWSLLVLPCWSDNTMLHHGMQWPAGKQGNRYVAAATAHWKDAPQFLHHLAIAYRPSDERRPWNQSVWEEHRASLLAPCSCHGVRNTICNGPSSRAQ